MIAYWHVELFLSRVVLVQPQTRHRDAEDCSHVGFPKCRVHFKPPKLKSLSLDCAIGLRIKSTLFPDSCSARKGVLP